MVKKFSACLLLVLLWCSGAWADMSFWSNHYSIAGLTDGHSDYSGARFWRLGIEITDTNTVPTAEDVSITGTLTLSGGNYSYWSGTEMKKVSGTQQTFPLVFDTGGTAGSGFLDYMPVDDNGNDLRFMSEADGGLKGVSGSAVFPNKPSYVEYIRSGTKVTGLTWRVVNPSNTSAPVTQAFRMRFRVRAVYKSGYETAYNGSNIEIAANETPQGTVTFDTPVEESEIWGIRVRLRTYETGTSSDYDWGFFKQSAPKMTLWRNHISRASITGGKSDYSDARFLSVFFDVRSDGDTVIEAGHLTDEGTFTIPGGGYSLQDDENGEELGVTIPTGTDRSYKLKVSDGTALTDSYYIISLLMKMELSLRSQEARKKVSTEKQYHGHSPQHST